MTFFVRTATEKDLPAIRALLMAAFEETYVPLHGAEKVAALNAGWNSQTVLASCLKDPSGEFLVADDGCRIGGVAFARPASGFPKTIGLLKLYVAPGLKRRGVGRSLLEEVEACFPGAERLRLEADAENTDAIAFYQSKGFTAVGRTENCGSAESGIPALILEKPL